MLTRHLTVKIFPIFQRPYVKKQLKSNDFALELLLRAIWGVSISKNHCQLTFAAIKTDWGVVRLPRLFLRIDMILGKLASTNIVAAKHFKNFLAHFNSRAHDRQHPLFESQESQLGKICSKTHENECLLAFLQIKNVFDTFGTRH